jgi:hypothetical protein
LISSIWDNYLGVSDLVLSMIVVMGIKRKEDKK